MEKQTIAGSSVGVIGGSIAGCAAAIALSRLGCDVTVLERSSAGLKDRGSGIAIPIALRDELVDAGYLPADYPVWRANARRWYVADGSDRGDLRWTQPGAMVTNNWGELWRGLRGHVPSRVRYCDGIEIVDIDQRDDGVVLTESTGASHQFDLVVGADGYRSVARTHLHPDSTPRYAGYILWRGNFPSSRLADRSAWDEVLETGEWLSVGFDGGHAVMYPIPDFEASEDGGLRVNWAIYAPLPDSLDLDGPGSIPPGSVSPACDAEFRTLLDAAIPPSQRELFESPRDELSIQPIYDELVDTYVGGRVILIGDAATLSRPHTGSGATKAIQDARLLEVLGQGHTTWGSLLAAYDNDRTSTGQTLVDLGRRIGRDQVENTPPWGDMTPQDFQAWTAGTLSGDTLYFWGDDEQ